MVIFKDESLVIVYWHFSRLKQQRFSKKRSIFLIFHSLANRIISFRFHGFLFFFFFHLSHSVSSDLIKNNEYVFFIRYIPGNENYIRNRNEFFFLTFSRLYFRKSIRDSEAKNFLKYVQTVSYFTLKKGRTLWKNVSTEMRNFRDTFIRSLPPLV